MKPTEPTYNFVASHTLSNGGSPNLEKWFYTELRVIKSMLPKVLMTGISYVTLG